MDSTPLPPNPSPSTKLGAGPGADGEKQRKAATPAERRSRRMWLYLMVVLAISFWRFFPRPWHPGVHLETAHLQIASTASQAQTEQVALVLEQLYGAYSNRFAALRSYRAVHRPLQVKLYKDRDEFRWVNPGLGWAEAFYKNPYCQAYYSSAELNPYHWMTHEATHQLNEEVAGLKLEKWLEEGIAEYFGTSVVTTNGFALGHIDPNTYPTWWLDDLATAPTLAENLRNGSVIPLKAIVTNSGGPSLRSQVNLYYLHWWSLTSFLFESPRYRDRVLALAEEGGRLAAFERLLGPVESVQQEWHAYVQQLKSGPLQSGQHRLTKTTEPK